MSLNLRSMSHKRDTSFGLGMRTAALFAAVTLFLVACSSVTADGPDRTVQSSPEALPAVDVSGMNVPISLDDLEVLDPSWATPPQYSSGIYLGAREQETALEFIAISIHGETLWSVERPLSCTGFTVTEMSDGTPLAVLVDTKTNSDAAATNSATAYDLETGEIAWGPVDLPGTFQGPGLVFASPPEEFMGSNGPRIALSPDTGNIIADERDGDLRIIGDFSGTILTVEGDSLIARTSHDNQKLWEVDATEYGWEPSQIRGSVNELTADTHALLTIGQGPGPVIDLATGEVVVESAREMGVDPATGTVIVLEGNSLHSFEPTNKSQWSVTVTPDTTIATVGGVFVYLREGDAIRVHNVLTGAVAMAYEADAPGAILVPAHLQPNGAGLLYNADGDLLIAAVPQVQNDSGVAGRPKTSSPPVEQHEPTSP